MKVSEVVFNEIEPLLNKDIKLVDVEYVKRNDGMHLVVYIDKIGGITVEDCKAVNDLISDKIDELNPTNDQKYYLDISSYGLDKPLKFDWQFQKYIGELVDVKLYRKIDGFKEFTAKLISKSNKTVTFEIDKQNKEFNLMDVAYILPHIEF